jgi:hypothetical protein
MKVVRLFWFVLAAIVAAVPAAAQPFLYSIHGQDPCDASGCASFRIVVTNARTGEVVNADDPPLLGRGEGIIYSVTASADGRRLFVSVGRNEGVGSLIAINTTTNREIARVTISPSMWMLVAAPDGRALYGTNPLDGRFFTIDPDTLTVVRTLRVGYPYSIATSADGGLIAVAEPNPSALTLIDAPSVTVRARVAMPDFAQRVALSGNGTRAYVASYGSRGKLTVVDTASAAVVGTIDTGTFLPTRLLVHPFSGRVYVTGQTAGAWGVLDQAGVFTTYAADVRAGATMVLSPDWRQLYIAGRSGVLVVDTTSDTSSGSLPGGADLQVAVSTSCDFVLPRQDSVFTPAGGSGTIVVPAPPGCEWAVQNQSLPVGVRLTSAAVGVGPGSVSYTMAPSGVPVSAGIRIAGQITRVTVEVPRVFLDFPRAGSAASPLVIAGWTLSQTVSETSNGIDVVHVWAFPVGGGVPTFLGDVIPSVPRPDVAAVFGPAHQRSGFGLTAPWLRPGAYHIAAFGHSEATGRFDAVAVVTVTATGESRAMSLDLPTDGFVVSPQETDVYLGGWAIDRAASFGSGVDVIHVWAYPDSGAAPRFVGEAAYGFLRPDVAALFGRSADKSGFSALLPKPPPGAYRLVVYARSTVTGQFDQARVVRLIVQ